MSRIEELITELCPDGVEFRPLRDVGIWYGGGTPSKNNAEFWQDGTVPWLSPKDMVVETIHATGLRVSVKALQQSPLKLVPAGSVAFVVRSNVLRRRFPIAMVPFDVTLNQDMRAVVPHEDVLPEYLLQACRSRAESILAVAGRTDGSMAAIKSATLLDFRIPIPPIDIQREVVGVLHRFSSLQAELELQLQAELELRRQQYRHYRDAILSFSERERERERVRWATLSDICLRVSSGATPTAGRPEYYEGGSIPWLRTSEVRFSDIRETEMTVTDRALRETAIKWIPADCVIVAISGATAGRSAVNKIPLTTNQHCCNLEIDPGQADYRYVFQWVSRNYDAIKAMGQGARADLNARLIKGFRIALPSLDEQRRIARLLDEFDARVDDLSSRLSAEIPARRQQYEYYRDKLLTFEDAA